MSEPTSPASAAEEPGKGAVDPSMEDILASIRRILSEEEEAPPAASAAVDDQADDDVLALDESMVITPITPAAAVAAPPPTMAAPPDVADPIPSLPPAVIVTAPSSAPELAPPDLASLVAPEAAAAATGAMSALVRSLQAERHAAIYRGGPTLEDVVREEIRPVLKAWLDSNLPGIVERIVRSEIERLVGRALP